MTTGQDKINAADAEIKEIKSILTTNVPLIQTGFANLEKKIADAASNGETLDTTDLEADIADLRTGVTGLSSLVPADAQTTTSTTTDPGTTATA